LAKWDALNRFLLDHSTRFMRVMTGTMIEQTLATSDNREVRPAR